MKAAGTAEEGLKHAGDADLILTDLKLPGMDGLAFLEQLRAQNMLTPVIVMSAFGTVEIAVEAMKKGAVDFLPKPFSLDHLTVVVEKALEVRKLRDENRELREALGQKYQFENIIGHSPAMQEIFATIMRVAPTRATVLLCGRKRRRQGHDRARDSSAFAAQGPAFRQDQLHGDSGKPDGERTVRLRKRRVHRREHLQARQVRSGQHRHGVAGRNRRRARRRSR